jgi:hypothetical protein
VYDGILASKIPNMNFNDISRHYYMQGFAFNPSEQARLRNVLAFFPLNIEDTKVYETAWKYLTE